VRASADRIGARAVAGHRHSTICEPPFDIPSHVATDIRSGSQIKVEDDVARIANPSKSTPSPRLIRGRLLLDPKTFPCGRSFFPEIGVLCLDQGSTAGGGHYKSDRSQPSSGSKDFTASQYRAIRTAFPARKKSEQLTRSENQHSPPLESIADPRKDACGSP